MSRVRYPVAVSIAALLMTSVLLAQDKPATNLTYDEVITDEWKAQADPFPIELKGRQVPYRMLVFHFFAKMHGYRSHPEIWDQVLRRMNYKPGSPAARELARVADLFPNYQPTEQERASRGVELDTLAAAGDEDTYNALALTIDKENAGRLGDLYRELADSLAAVGSSMDGVERYIYNRIAPGTTMGALGPLTADFFSIGAEFNQRAGLTESGVQ